ncbi:TPA: autotransporter outer membrane beta-barrel domain-containing protein [Pseudomonas putida]|uniref:autotransporter family protein n=1 Tax=Pseudomonas putida group TaxID=136845 RepID=UPI001E3D2887|nr:MULTISPECIES: autotransporter outer membrane beta-barrel domain-containing protein [Pseudomonas putida group]MCE0904730.1 autotransporter outer membrane beta-barrel domain-containing protein [Pseudomonas alloputida]HEJ1056749.1 autotransporter outer membrane beta-barrel domain-containing protein [Pseudomonas putida]
MEVFLMRLRLMLTLGSLPLLGMVTPAQANCTFAPGPGNDTYTCDSGTAPALVDSSGDNRLVFPASGSGAITGDVTFGAGKDSIDMGSGSIGGNVNQGAGIDDFVMSGGVIEGNLNQGDGLDTFHMSGGWIKGTFDSGDYAEMDDGRIGNVNMRLDENTFIMRGGSVDRNVITAFDKDYIEVFEGNIGGNISVSGGDDQVLVHGGQVGGDVLLSTGNDRFTWDGGRIGGRVDAGPGDDTALLKGLTPEVLSITLDGGEGNDSLTFDASQPAGGAHYVNWERVALNNGSRLVLDDTLVLGDSNSSTGSLALDASSRITSRQGVITAFAPGQRAAISNAGTLDLTAGNDAMGRLRIEGDYTGINGTLRLNSVLDGDGAASDRLVVSRGAIAGSTQVLINNLNGAGAATAQNGIQVVEARDGATSTATAFVQTQRLSAGAYDYRLFKGGVTAGSENSWYLRSTLVAPPAPAPVPAPGEPPVIAPAVTPPVAAPAPGQAELPAPVQGQSLPLYRPEVPVYAAAPRGAAIIARQALGTFHQRQGDQLLLQGDSALPASWGQAYGGTLRQQWSGTVSPSLDGDLYGFKVGQDLYAKVGENGYRQHVGIYVSHSRLDADVKGFALAVHDRSVGDLKLDGDSVGTYWTLVGPQGAYLDAVLQYTRLDGRARSERGDTLNLDGHAWTASLESGYPITLSERWHVEPQAQLIAQKVALDSASDSVSRIRHDAQVELTGRLGLRLEGAFTGSSGRLLQPYAQVNLWHGDGGRDTLSFDDADKIKTDYRYTSVQLESGVVAQVNEALSLHGGVRYTANLDSRQQEASGVNLGVRWQF